MVKYFKKSNAAKKSKNDDVYFDKKTNTTYYGGKEHYDWVTALEKKADKLFKAYKSQGFTQIVEFDIHNYEFLHPEINLGVELYDDTDEITLSLDPKKGRSKSIYYNITFNEALKIKDVINFIKQNGK